MNGVQAQAGGENSKVKVKVRVNIHGVFVVSSASMIEKVVDEPMETEDAPAAGEKPAEEVRTTGGDWTHPSSGEDITLFFPLYRGVVAPSSGARCDISVTSITPHNWRSSRSLATLLTGPRSAYPTVVMIAFSCPELVSTILSAGISPFTLGSHPHLALNSLALWGPIASLPSPTSLINRPPTFSH